MEQDKIREALTSLLTDVAAKAKQDAINGQSDIGSIFRRDKESLNTLDVASIEEAIKNIDKATTTKEGTRRLMNGLFLVAKLASRAL